MVKLDHVKSLGFDPIHGSSTLWKRTVATTILVVSSIGIPLILCLQTLPVTVIGNMLLEIRGSLCLHATSKSHSDAIVAWQQFRLNQQHKTTLAHRMDQLGEQTLRSNWHYIKTIAEIILLYAHQEIALRDHIELTHSQNPGNFRAILDLVVRHDDCFHQSYEGAARNAVYTSPDIQNQLANYGQYGEGNDLFRFQGCGLLFLVSR